MYACIYFPFHFIYAILRRFWLPNAIFIAIKLIDLTICIVDCTNASLLLRFVVLIVIFVVGFLFLFCIWFCCNCCFRFNWVHAFCATASDAAAAAVFAFIVFTAVAACPALWSIAFRTESHFICISFHSLTFHVAVGNSPIALNHKLTT